MDKKGQTRISEKKLSSHSLKKNQQKKRATLKYPFTKITDQKIWLYAFAWVFNETAKHSPAHKKLTQTLLTKQREKK